MGPHLVECCPISTSVLQTENGASVWFPRNMGYLIARNPMVYKLQRGRLPVELLWYRITVFSRDSRAKSVGLWTPNDFVVCLQMLRTTQSGTSSGRVSWFVTDAIGSKRVVAKWGISPKKGTLSREFAERQHGHGILGYFSFSDNPTFCRLVY